MSITSGFLLDYFRDATSVKNPILQVVDKKSLTPERALIAVSDGTYATQALLSGQALELMNSNQITLNCLVRLDAFTQAPRKVQLPPGVLIVQTLTILEHDRPRLEGLIPVAQVLTNQASAGGAAAGGAGAGAGAGGAHSSDAMSDGRGAAGAAAGAGPIRSPYGAGGAAMRQTPTTYVSGNEQFVQIRALNQYQRNWKIKARVTTKSDIRTWTNDRGTGQLFSMELLDQFGGQIRAVAYSDACDKWFPVIKENHVYIISGAQVRLARKTNFARQIHDYELTLDTNNTDIREVPDDNSIGAIGLTSRKTIGQIQEMKVASNDPSNSAGMGASGNDALVDVVGILKDVKPTTKIIAKKSSRELTKRDISIVDRSLLQIDVTLWGEQAEQIPDNAAESNPVVVITACRVSDFNGRSLSTSFDSHVYLDPEMPECIELKKWYLTEGVHCSFNSISMGGMSSSGAGRAGGNKSSERKSFADVDENMLRTMDSNHAEWLTVRATITFFKTDRGGQQVDRSKPIWYEGCTKCNRKVHNDGSGVWGCDTCGSTMTTPNYVYNFSFQASDYQTSRWINVFGEKGDNILGYTAQQMAEFYHNQPAEYDSIIQRTNYQTFEMRVSARPHVSREGEPGVRWNLWQATPLNYAEEARRMLAELQVSEVKV